MGNMLEPTKKY